MAMDSSGRTASNGPFVYRGAYQQTYGPKSYILRAIGPSPQEKRPQNTQKTYNASNAQNECGQRKAYKHIVAKPYRTMKPADAEGMREDDLLDQSIKNAVESIQDKTTVQHELNSMQPLPISRRKECQSARTCTQLERQELDLLRQNSLRGRRSTRAGREEPASDWRDQEDFIPGESIDWIFKQ